MKFSAAAFLIAGGFVANVTASTSVWSGDGQCQWLFQRTSGTKSSKGTYPPTATTNQGDPYLFCDNGTRRRHNRRRKLKGEVIVYNYVEFGDECGCLHTTDGYSCVEEKLDTHEVIIRDCDGSLTSQLWVTIPLTPPHQNMVLFENHATRRCMQRNANPDGYSMFTATCDIYNDFQMFQEPAAESFYYFYY